MAKEVMPRQRVFNIIVLLLYLMIINKSNLSRSNTLNRKKRFLLFPEGPINIIQLIIGIGVPVEVEPESVIVGWAFRAFYTMPTNISQLMLQDYGSRARNRRSTVSRWDVYKALEQQAEMHGFGGKSCVLKAICEAAETPLDQEHGIFEELFHTLFTPTTTEEDIADYTDNEYYAAHRLGESSDGECSRIFADCKISILETITQLRNHSD
ncbi:unnamed protein product [Callosobruchus maculatus]|uniref:Uncharacterized protein n=1 Tax=Callosobruchus maculatus TaxID=64391 RepID=A0A653DK32_CALMS|nr:unnamed protein product [Callosobruchus maculatus]